MNTITAPYKDRIEFWKFQNASITFFEAMLLCDFILKEGIVSGHPLHPSLMTALHVLYGRPFRPRPEVRISGVIVPSDYSDTHDALLKMRDKIYAHTDVDGLKTTDDDCLNKVGVVIQGGSARFAMTMVFPRDVQKIRSLTEALADTTWCRAEEIWKTYFKDDFVEDGNYEVNISKTDDTFLKVSSW